MTSWTIGNGAAKSAKSHCGGKVDPKSLKATTVTAVARLMFGSLVHRETTTT